MRGASFYLVVAIAAVSLLTATSTATSLLQTMWQTTLPNTTVPLDGVVPGWSLLSDNDGIYATTSQTGRLFVVNITDGSVMWSFNDWNDGVPAATAAQRTIVSTENSVLVLRGDVLHSLDLVTGLHRYSRNIGVNATEIEVVTGDFLLAVYNQGGSIAVLNPSDGSVYWQTQLAAGGNFRVDASGVVAAQTATSTTVSLVVFNAADGSAIFTETFNASSLQFLYVMAVDSASVQYIVVQQTQQVVRAVFGPMAIRPIPYTLSIADTIWGYGIAGGYLYFQVGNNNIRVSTYNHTDGTLLGTSPNVGASAGAGHIVGESKFAVLAYATNTSYNLTGWNGANATLRFAFVFADSGSSSRMAASGAAFTHMSKKTSTTGFLGNTVVYNLVANFDGQMFVPTAAGGFHFVNGNTMQLDDTYVSAYPGLVLQSMCITHHKLVFSYGDTITAVTWA